jgi:type I restriction enzyme S subunit
MHRADVGEAAVTAAEVLVARSNTRELVGRVSMFEGIPGNVVASDLTIRLWARDGEDGVTAEFLSRYLSYLFQTGYWRERAGGGSGTMKKITREQISAVMIPVPYRIDQKRIAADLSDRLARAERLTAQIREELAAIDSLPAALLREAFRGTDTL